MGFRWTPSGACGCCIGPCDTKAYHYFNTTAQGTGGHMCDTTFTPDPAPADWNLHYDGFYDPVIGGYSHMLKLNGIWYYIRGYDVSTHEMDLDTAGWTGTYNPVYWDFILKSTVSGTGKWDEAVFTPDDAPYGWAADMFPTGCTLQTENGSVSTWTNSTTAITVTIAENVPRFNYEILNLTGRTTNISIASGVCTPSVPPEGWWAGSLVGFGYTLHVVEGGHWVDYTGTVTANTTTTATLSSYPADGTYSNGTFTMAFYPRLTGYCTVKQTADFVLATSTGLVGGEFDGRTVNLRRFDSIEEEKVISSNSATAFTVSTPSTFHGSQDWSFPYIATSGQCYLCTTTFNTLYMAGWPGYYGGGGKFLGAIIELFGVEYTLTTMTANWQWTLNVDPDPAANWEWVLDEVEGPAWTDEYWDMTTTGTATGTFTGLCGSGLATCSSTFTTTAGGDVSVIYRLPYKNASTQDYIYQYKLSVGGCVGSYLPLGTYALLFGPDGLFDLTLTLASDSLTITLNCGDYVKTWTTAPSSYYYESEYLFAYGLEVDVVKYGDNYIVSGYTTVHTAGVNCVETFYPDSLAVPKDYWEAYNGTAAEHRFGVKTTNTAAQFCELLVYETRGNGKTECALWDPCLYIPGRTTTTPPDICLTIPSGEMAGTYTLTRDAYLSLYCSMYGYSPYFEWPFIYRCEIDGSIYAATLTGNEDGTLTISTDSLSPPDTFSPPFTNLHLSNGFIISVVDAGNCPASSNPCILPPTGACCVPDGGGGHYCINGMTQADCTSYEGTWLEGTGCDPDPC
jgi:hypothetical protein